MSPSSTTTIKPRKPTGSKGKPKPGSRKNRPKKPVSEEERSKKLFSSLCSQIDGGHFANAIKTCDKILRIYPDDADALSTKLFLLLQTDQYKNALAVINGEKGQSRLQYERAYALYRSHDDKEAQNAIQSLKDQNADDRGLAHLEAQLFYRDGLYQEAYNLYNELLDSTDPVRYSSSPPSTSAEVYHQDTEEHSDILTNLQATQKHLDFINNDYLRAIDSLPTSVTNTIETAPPPAPAHSIPTVSASAQQQPSTALPEKLKKVRKSRVPPWCHPWSYPTTRS
ncbi:hypothetical protein NP233_g7442 [Leucocoprinus birnbaumii]|uniref:Signal recognition particle subunit SRP72 n=1 Tax=Leucocoprinus birnbaumii TaxID=56174 RepID=A0AAD5VPB4_9AGAR|nr:hypothetical protein NP233_g7442 [Leucocoprinus birnbaumii]